MKPIVLAVAAVILLALGCWAGSHEGEFTWYEVTGPGHYNVMVVTGHGKTCYVFDSLQQPVILWCEEAKQTK
jgi:hypothetical protein